ncbi:hypothetical protein OF117_20325 [Geodermatophilus sp. YIM 151500]|uniref:hypothetical protein n=1 Tax=Geodermatophilus sp. YIM 151500 TaxID=2984531 RepID=UPI0021E37FEF|nr:hypothetical protein [Geodermatophilus sp. YIM 151500]MCV2491697.1 hypothetical protein [Geodermatophilus sp. YIM 151500]
MPSSRRPPRSAPARRSPRAAPVRRSPRAAPRAVAPTRPQARPTAAVLAAVFGVLVAVVDGYLAWLLREPGAGLDRFLAVPLVLAAVALAGSVLVFTGRARGWLVLAVASAVPLVSLLGLALLFGALGGGAPLWSSLLLLVAPVGALATCLRRPVRAWSAPAAVRRPARGGRRGRTGG